MKLNRKHFRAIICYNFRRGLTQQQCIDELNSVFGDEVPSRTSFYWWYGEFNRGRSSLQGEFREGRPKSVIVPETIDDVSYPEIETTLGISGISRYWILHEHLTVKKICSRWIPHYLSIAQKRLVPISRKKCSKNTIAVHRNTSMTSWQVMICGFTRVSPKVNSSRLYGCFKMSQMQQKLLEHETLSSKWSPAFLEKLDMSQSYH